MNTLHWKTALRVLKEIGGENFIVDQSYGNDDYPDLFRLRSHSSRKALVDIEMDHITGKLRLIHIHTIDGEYVFVGSQVNKPAIRSFMEEIWWKETRLKGIGRRSSVLLKALDCYVFSIKEHAEGYVVI